MLKKRLIGVVIVRQGLAVQSFGYHRYLPLGRPEIVIENLDRWGADEILVHCIDRSQNQSGPDFTLLKRIGDLGISTPLIYGGGIRHVEDAVQVVRLGADRISVDSMLFRSPHDLEKISRELGTQVLIVNMPVRVKANAVFWLNYHSKLEVPLSVELINELPLKWASELMLTDWAHEGVAGGFDQRIVEFFSLRKKPLIVFGGLSEASQLSDVLSRFNVVAAGVGNFLSYKEHALQKIKQQLFGVPIRSAKYANEEYKY